MVHNIAVQKAIIHFQFYCLMYAPGNQLTPTMDGFHCSFHGSDFDKMANVRKGSCRRPPAEYPIAITGNILIIQITKTPQ